MLTLTIILTVIFLLTSLSVTTNSKYGDNHKGREMVRIVSRFQFITFFIIMFLCFITAYQVNEANKIKSQIILMKPLEKYKIDVAITEKELLKVERLIDRAIDKNNPNVSVKMENNVKIYSFLGSSDLGSAELGNAEKQKLLIQYIHKQNEIADQLIYINKLAYGDDFYKLQQEYSVYANSMFFGWAIRKYSIKENYIPVLNQIYTPN